MLDDGPRDGINRAGHCSLRLCVEELERVKGIETVLPLLPFPFRADAFEAVHTSNRRSGLH